MLVKVVIILLLPYSIWAANKAPVVTTFQIPGLIVKEKSSLRGEFHRLITLVIKGFSPEIKVQILPPQRAHKEFLSGKSAVFFPATPSMIKDLKFKLCRSKTVAYKKDYIFYLNGKPASRLEDLKNKMVGITRGFPFNRKSLRSYGIKLIEVQKDTIGLKMLALKRLDYFIAEEVSGLSALKETKIKNINYDIQNPVSEQEGYFAINLESPHGKKICNHVKERVDELIANSLWSHEKMVKQLRADGLKTQ